MRTIKHPLSGALYDLTEDGFVEVSREGRVGRFTSLGKWVSGDVRQADPHLCLWIGGLSAGANRFQQAAAAVSDAE